MAEAHRVSPPWKPGDDISALRLETMRQLAESAQLSALGTNVRLYRGAQGGTAIAVDPAPPRAAAVLVYIDSARTGGGIYKAYIVETFPAAIDTTIHIDDHSFGTTEGTEVTVVNFQEMNTGGTHWLTEAGNGASTGQRYYVCDPLGISDEEGRSCLKVNAAWFYICE